MRTGARTVHLTHLKKIFWAEPGYTKRDLLQYYADVASVLLPRVTGRAMVMKRYPNGAAGGIDNIAARVRKLGDLWSPLAANRGHFNLEKLL